MRILIISQNAYPFQSPRAFRTTELSEQLVKMGHDVTVYSVHGSCKYGDYEADTGVKMRPIPAHFPVSHNDGQSRYNYFRRFLFHCFHRSLFYPEIEFVFLIDSLLQKEQKIDMLITIAYPHSIHLGAARSKRKHPNTFPKVWIADCGDPFYLNPFFNCPRYFEKFEREWCSQADYITIPIEEGRNGYFPEYQNKIRIVPQGFNFQKTPVAEYNINTIPTFAYAGSLYGKRNPQEFIRYLSTLQDAYVFYLFTRHPVSDEYKRMLGDKLINVVGKKRSECIYELSKMDFLVNFTNPSVIQSPSKLIDYGIAGRPIVDVNIPFDNQEFFMQFLRGNYSAQHVINCLERYKIENVAESFVELAQS